MTLRSIHFASVLLFLLANLLVALFVLPSPALGEQEPEPVQPVYLFTYPRGSTAELISDLPVGESDRVLYGGIVTIPVTEEIYFYDLDFDNIKVIDPTNGSLLRLIDGPWGGGRRYIYPWDREYSWPQDMAVAPDGTITLLLESGGGGQESLDFRRLSPGDTRWTQVVRVGVRALGLEPAGNAYHLDVGPDGSVYVFFYRNYRSIPLDSLAARVSGKRLSDIWDGTTPTVVGADGLFYSINCRIPDQGGLARLGNCLVRVRDRGGRLLRSFEGRDGQIFGVSGNSYLAYYGGRIEVTDPQGEIVAITQYPNTRGRPERALRGGRLVEFFLSPAGRLYSCHVTKEGLEVYLHWKEE